MKNFYMGLVASFVLMLFFLPREAGAAGVCPKADDLNHYLTTKLRSEKDAEKAGQLNLFYKLLKPFNPSKPTLLMINGGPGGTHEIINSAQAVGDSLNIVSFDHRGIGCTKIMDSTSVEYEPGLFSMDRASDDIEALRRDLLGENGKWFVYGISYGAMLAQKYTFKNPNSVLGLILDSASHKASNFALARNQYFDLFIKLNPEVNELFSKVVIRYPDARMHVLRQISRWTYSYTGRTLLIKEFLEKILAAPDEDSAKKIYLSGPDVPFVGMAQQITCEELYDFPVVKTNYFWSALDEQCPIFKARSNQMDFSEDLKKLNVRTLILGGRFDPVTPMQGMREMYELMPNAFLYENGYAGHGIFVEKTKCAFQLVGSFMASQPWSHIKAIAQMEECIKPPGINRDETYAVARPTPF